MAKTISITASDGTTVQFVDEVIGSGAMKDVYFSPDKKYVVGFFRNKQDVQSKDRLKNITEVYRDRIFNQAGGQYWENLFCWPTKMVEWEGKTGIVCPTYKSHFFFSGGPFKGKEKEGKWFASAKLRNKFLPATEKGTWLTHFHMCIHIARAVKRLHAAGLAHSDLSYKNVLVDPVTGRASIIDIDGLVEIFSVCWPMYDAMPAFFKDAILKSYEAIGWDLSSSTFEGEELEYPDFEVLTEQLDELIGNSDYASDIKSNYRGALLTRVKSLTVGLNKSIFTTEQTPYDQLFDNNCILDISRVKSTETKALIMGLMVYMLNEYRLHEKICGFVFTEFHDVVNEFNGYYRIDEYDLTPLLTAGANALSILVAGYNNNGSGNSGLLVLGTVSIYTVPARADGNTGVGVGAVEELALASTRNHLGEVVPQLLVVNIYQSEALDSRSVDDKTVGSAIHCREGCGVLALVE